MWKGQRRLYLGPPLFLLGWLPMLAFWSGFLCGLSLPFRAFALNTYKRCLGYKPDYFRLYGRNEKGEPDGSPHQNHNDTRPSLPLFTSIIGRAGNTDPRSFIKAILWVKERRRAQMQGAGHPIEVTGLALALVRFIITDVANPGGSFHIVAAAHSFSLELSFYY